MKRIALMIALVLLSLGCDNQPQCFVKKLFDFSYPKEDLYQITLTQTNQNYSMKAYGDFNSDLKTDYVSISSSGQVQVFLAQSSNLFAVSATLDVPPLSTAVRVYLYDLNNDEQLDITLWCALNNGSFILQPYSNNGNGSFSMISSVKFVSQGPTTDPVLMSVRVENGFNKYGFLLYESINGRVIIYYLNQIYQIFQFSTYFQGQSSYSSLAFSSPHSNTYVDITNDCNPDMLLTNANQQLQIWIFNSQSGKYILSGVQVSSSVISQGILKGVEWINYVDVNYDGGIDVVMIAQTGIFVALGQGLSINDQFCVYQRYSYSFNFDASALIYTAFEAGYQLPAISSSQPPKFGDINIDGYPDLALLLYNDATTTIQPMIYKNEGGQFSIYNDPYNNKITSGMQSSNCISISFFDILQNGIVDLMVVWSNQAQSQLYTQAYYNNYLYQNDYYIKGYATGGLITSAGAQLPGASFYWINSVSDSQRVAYQPQLIQSAYDALSLPYAVVGLGHANNYVQSFTIGRTGQSRSWSPIIPNSQLAIFTGNSDPSAWGIKIFVMPTESLIYVIIVCLVILGILGIILVVFRWRKVKGKQQQSLLEVMT